MSRILKINRDGLTLYDKHLMLNYPDISDNEARKMLHALGADNAPYRKYAGNKFYHAHRNYYDAGGEDIKIWDGLVEKELANKNKYFYHVTVRGIRLLEFLTQCKIYDAKENVADCKKAVLRRMIEHDVFCGYGCWLPISSRTVADSLAIPVPLARKTLNKLAEEGYVCKDYFGEIDDEGYPHCVHGWNCTKKVQELEIYGILQKEEYRRMDEIFNAKEWTKYSEANNGKTD